MNKVICVGSAGKDIFLPTREGVIIDTPDDMMSQKKIAFEFGGKIYIEDRFEAPGGCAVNVSQGLARLGVNVACNTKIGNDEVGKWIMSELEKEGVDIGLVEIDEQSKTDLSVIIVEQNSGDRTIFVSRDANEKLKIQIEKIKDTQWIFLSSLCGSWQKNMDEVARLLDEKDDLKLAFNPGQGNLKNDCGRIIEMIKKTDILIVNKDEAIEIVMSQKKMDKQDLNEHELNHEKYLIAELYKLGPKIISLTDGENGAWAYDGEKVLYLPADRKIRSIDSTGAGDAFTSGFLAILINGGNISEALKWGIVNSANIIQYYGAKKGLFTKNEIKSGVEHLEVQEI